MSIRLCYISTLNEMSVISGRVRLIYSKLPKKSASNVGATFFPLSNESFLGLTCEPVRVS